MFGRKKTVISKQPSIPSTPNPNLDYRPPMGLECTDADRKCPQECNVLNELRCVQNSIIELEQHKDDLEHMFFPTLYWAVVAIVGCTNGRIPGYLFYRGSVDHIDKEGVAMLLQYFKEELHKREDVNREKFDVDKFCQEVKDYMHTDDTLRNVNGKLNALYEKQSRLKEELGIK